MNTPKLLPQPTLLDALCSYVEGQVRRHILTTPSSSPIRAQTVVKAHARETITGLLSKPIFLNVLRKQLPAHSLIHQAEPSDLDFWRLTAQLEALLNDQSDIDIDDATALAFLANVVVQSALADLRGG